MFILFVLLETEPTETNLDPRAYLTLIVSIIVLVIVRIANRGNLPLIRFIKNRLHRRDKMIEGNPDISQLE